MNTEETANANRGRIGKAVIWSCIIAVLVFSFFVLATSRHEPVNALWLCTAALCTYAIAYRFYGRYIARRVLGLDPGRTTPAHRYSNGIDFVPTNKYVLFGHHFAAIAGAGPLIGPVLAAQMGYLPGILWLLVGAVFAGAVQDFVILVLSTRRDGRSLGEMVRMELGPLTGGVAMIGIFMIMMILLAVLALIVVKALVGSPWGCFAVFCTIPIAFLMGLYGRYLRPGHLAEMSALGLICLLISLVCGGYVAENPALSVYFTFSGTELAFILMVYGFVASVLPVWMLLAPRDYLSTFLKIGTIAGLAVGIAVVTPNLQMPAITKFVDGSGPVFAGTLFPFLFITIACGAVSGFHALVSSGTTPKMIAAETDALFIGYGAMLTESFVGIMALIAASVLQPGVYFAMNAPPAVIGTTAVSAAETIGSWGYEVSPDMLTNVAKDIGETSILSRAGGAPTLAVGMAQILAPLLGGRALLAFWYHFAILFEALFILTTLDAGTRVARFMIQDMAGAILPRFRETSAWLPNVAATTIVVMGWGYFLYQGVVDPLGGINTFWPLFGIANQMLAGIALTLGSVVLLRSGRPRLAWVTLLPTGWLLICTLSAGWEKLFSGKPAIGFLAHGRVYADSLTAGHIMKPAGSLAEMRRIVLNDRVDAVLTGIFMVVVVTVVCSGIRKLTSGLGDTAGGKFGLAEPTS